MHRVKPAFLYFKNVKDLRQGLLLPVDNYWLRGDPKY